MFLLQTIHSFLQRSGRSGKGAPSLRKVDHDAKPGNQRGRFLARFFTTSWHRQGNVPRLGKSVTKGRYGSQRPKHTGVRPTKAFPTKNCVNFASKGNIWMSECVWKEPAVFRTDSDAFPVMYTTAHCLGNIKVTRGKSMDELSHPYTAD